MADKGYSRKKLDLTGQRYGKLTVLAPAENVGASTAWLCRCDCGRETVVKTRRLRGGRTVSCGCVGPGKGVLSLTYVDGTCVEMIRANTLRSNNTSGVPGVEWQASKGRWRAAICFKGRRYYLGSYARFEDAAAARKRAEEALFQPLLEEFGAPEPAEPAQESQLASVRMSSGPPMSRAVNAAEEAVKDPQEKADKAANEAIDAATDKAVEEAGRQTDIVDAANGVIDSAAADAKNHTNFK